MTDIKVALRLDAENGELVSAYKDTIKQTEQLETSTNKTAEAMKREQYAAAAAGAAMISKAAAMSKARAEAEQLSAKTAGVTANAKSATSAVRLEGAALEAAAASAVKAAGANASLSQILATGAVRGAKAADAFAAITRAQQAQATAAAASAAANTAAAGASNAAATATTKQAAATTAATSATKAHTAEQRDAAVAAKGTGAATDGLFAKLTSLKNLIVGGVVLKFALELISAGNAIRSYEATLTAATGSQERARQELAFVRAEADRVGVAFQTVVPEYAKLAAAAAGTSLQGQGVRDIFTAITEKGRALGLSNEALGGTFTAVTQMMGKGKITAEELRGQLAERIPDAIQIMARALGLSTAELDKQMQAGTLLAEDVLPKFAAELRKSAAAGLEMQRNSPAAEFARLKNALFDAASGFSNNSGFLDLLATGAKFLRSVLEGLPEVLGRVKGALDLWAGTFTSANEAMNGFGTDLANSTKTWGGLVMDAVAFIGDALLQLPANIRGLFVIVIGETDQFVTSAKENFELFGNTTAQVWNAVKATVSGVVGDVRILFASMVDGIVGTAASLVERLAAIANKVGATDVAAGLEASVAKLREAGNAEAEVRASVEKTANAYTAKSAALAAEREQITATADTERAASQLSIDAGLAEVDAQKRTVAARGEAERAAWSLGKAGDAMAAGTKGATAALDDHGKAANRLATAEKAALDMLDTLRGGLNATAQAQADFDKGTRELEQRMEAWAIAGGDVTRIVALWQQGEDLLRANLAKTNAEILKRNALTNGNKDVVAQLAQQRGQLAGLTTAQLNYNAGVEEANKLAEQAIENGVAQATVDADLADRLTKLAELRDNADMVSLVDQFGSKSDYDQLVENIDKVGEAISKTWDPAKLLAFQRVSESLNKDLKQHNLALVSQGVTSLQKFAKEGTAAYTALGIAQDILAYKAAVASIATQGEGDPYSAFARIAAMIALMASIGIRVSGGGSGPSANGADARQETQGTGTVLGDATAKSESISKAIEITANATTQLVGLNRGMLNALRSLQDALGAAGNQLARGAGDVPTPELAGGGGLQATPIGSMFDDFLFGGGQKIIDQGIIIAGGRLSEMLNGIVVGAYQTIETDGGLFGDDETSDQLSTVSDAFKTQFQLVIKSIADTVREGALALGLLPADIEAAMAEYQVAETRISLQGLSADDQQAALEAVFSSIFDGLAGAVVPFIGQFQQVGEGLGETLVRVATEVQVTQEAFKQLGIAVDETDPERFAQIADGLVQAAGGLDNFISGMQSFVNAFAPEQHKFEVASDALTSALSQVGLTLPTTRDGMFDLMQSLDATTEEGRKQIALLLELTGVADAYYTALEKVGDAQANAVAGYSDFMAQFGRDTLAGALAKIRAEELKNIDTANRLARAAGLEGASERDLAAIHEYAAKKIVQAILKLRDETEDLIDQLYGGGGDALDTLNDQIAQMQANANGAASGLSDASSSLRDLYRQQVDGLKSIQDYLDSMLLGDLSALSPEEQLAEARRQLEALQQAAAGGDADALAALPQAADAFLRLSQQFNASGTDYGTDFDWVRQLLQGLVDVGPIADPGGDPTGNGGGGNGGVSPELQALLDRRDQLLAQQEGAYRAELAEDLANHLRELAAAVNTPVLELMQTMGVDLTTLATDIGVDLANITGSSVQALGTLADALGVRLSDLTTDLGLNLTDLGAGLLELTTGLGIDFDNLTGAQIESLAGLASSLGLSLTEITQALGLNLTDLSAGVLDLTQSLGIDLEHMTVQSTQSLAALAEQLGVDVGELATSVGVDLGHLTDRQSLLNQALAETIDGLPDGTRDQLAPLLDAITNATNEADANAAIDALNDAVNLLSPDIRNELAPYLEDVFPQDSMDDLDYLSGIYGYARDTVDSVDSVRGAIERLGQGMDLPGFAVGSTNIPYDMTARVHQGEIIAPAPVSDFLRRAGITVRTTGTGDTGALEDLVRQLTLEVAQLREDVRSGALHVADTVETCTERGAEVNAAAIDRQTDALSRSRT